MRYSAVALFLCFSVCGFGQPAGQQELYIPEVFNRFGYVHGRLVFAPGGEEAFWVISTVDQGRSIDHRVILKRHPDGTWLEPRSSFLSVDRKENSPSYSADGQRLFYQSRAPVSGDGPNKDLDIWYRDRNGDGWGIPVNIGLPVNSGEDESQPWVTSDGSLFFCRQNPESVPEGRCGSDVWFSQCINGQYAQPVCMGPEINSSYQDTEPVMAPDGSYLLFISNRPGGYSRMMNLYVSYRTPEGGWTKAICLSHQLKIDNVWFPSITADGKYLFFCGGYPTGHGYNQSQYYRVSTSVIDSLNPEPDEAVPGRTVNNRDFIHVICDNTSFDTLYRHDDGFSCLVSFRGNKILFDAGSSREGFLHNLKLNGIEPKNIDEVFISHNHSDHINGLVDFIPMNPGVRVFMSGEMPGNTKGNGVLIFERSCAAAKPGIVYSIDPDTPYRISEDVYSTGFLKGTAGPSNVPVKEQSLVLDTEKGLVIVTGCSHPGLINIVKRAKELSGKPVYLVLGGFHLAGGEITEDQIISLIRELQNLGVQKCGPAHCTGELARRLFKRYFRDGFVEIGAGMNINL